MQPCFAIVLQPVTQYHFYVFDQCGGLQQIIYPYRNAEILSRGVMFEYYGKKQNKFFHVVSAHLVAEPARWVRKDIWFLHHMIDVLANSLALYQPEPEIFQLLLHMYTPIDYADIEYAKLALLGRIFFLLGIQPDNILHLQTLMQHVAYNTFLQIVQKNAYSYNAMREWLEHCTRLCEIYKPLKTRIPKDKRGLS